MGSQNQYQVVLVIVSLLFFLSAGRIFAHDENPPVEPTGLLGVPPVQANAPSVDSTPPSDDPDSIPVIDHPPETDQQPNIESPSEQPQPRSLDDSPSGEPEPTVTIDSLGDQSELKASQQIKQLINKLDFIW